MIAESAAPAVEEIRFYRSNKPFGFMSNLYPVPIEFEGRTFAMRDVLKAKFTQHPELASQLLATGAAKLIEESLTDPFWGTGRNGKGQNMLGQLLMEVREWIRKEHVG